MLRNFLDSTSQIATETGVFLAEPTADPWYATWGMPYRLKTAINLHYLNDFLQQRFT